MAVVRTILNMGRGGGEMMGQEKKSFIRLGDSWQRSLRPS